MPARAAIRPYGRLAGAAPLRLIVLLFVVLLPLSACAGRQAGGFGVLPVPRLAPPDETVGAPAGAPLPYFGPAHLRLGTPLPKLPANLPVWRFAMPSAGGLAREAGAHGGRPVLASAPDFREPLIYVPHSTTLPAGEPVAPATTAEPAAQAFLSQHKLVPAWPHQTEVLPSGPVAVVEYLRMFTVPGASRAPQVDAHGTAAGASVAVAPDGTVLEATVPAPVTFSRHLYPAKSRSRLAAAAVSAAPQSRSGVEPVPDVVLTSSTLVYLAVAGGKAAYFEPALLLRGQFAVGGQSYEKRVLVPALAGG